jgi:hypothetical protein
MRKCVAAFVASAVLGLGLAVGVSAPAHADDIVMTAQCAQSASVKYAGGWRWTVLHPGSAPPSGLGPVDCVAG